MSIEAEEIYSFKTKPTIELSETDFEQMARVLDAQKIDSGLITQTDVTITPGTLTFRQLGQIPISLKEFNIEHTVADIIGNKVVFVGPIRFQQLAMEHHHFEVFEVNLYGMSYSRLPLLEVEDKRLVELAYLGTEFKKRHA